MPRTIVRHPWPSLNRGRRLRASLSHRPNSSLTSNRLQRTHLRLWRSPRTSHHVKYRNATQIVRPYIKATIRLLPAAHEPRHTSTHLVLQNLHTGTHVHISSVIISRRSSTHFQRATARRSPSCRSGGPCISAPTSYLQLMSQPHLFFADRWRCLRHRNAWER